MFETLILAVPLVLVTLKARQLGRNQLVWAVIAAVSYLVPLLLIGSWIMPMVNAIDPYVNVLPISFKIVGMGFGLIGGWFAYMRLVFIGPAAALSD